MNIMINGQLRQVADRVSIASLLEELGMAEKHVAVEVNLQLVPRAGHAAKMLEEGDRLEVVTLMGGG